MPEKRPTASTINDEQLDALWTALDEVSRVHTPVGDPQDYDEGAIPCPECGYAFCATIEIISRQRSIALEPPICPKDGPDRRD
jgi:hypothetical protein